MAESIPVKEQRIVMTVDQFNRKQMHVHQTLQAEMTGNHKVVMQGERKNQFNDRTGWLPGSLSYPWVLIALSIIPILAAGNAII